MTEDQIKMFNKSVNKQLLKLLDDKRHIYKNKWTADFGNKVEEAKQNILNSVKVFGGHAHFINDFSDKIEQCFRNFKERECARC